MSKSSASSTKTPANLPQRPGAWHLTVRKLSILIEMDDGILVRPYITMLADLEREQILDFEFSPDLPEADEVRGILWRAMLKPQRELRQPPYRPQEILCDQDVYVQELTVPLLEAGIKISSVASNDSIDELISMLEEEFGEESEVQPGLLSVAENTPELVGGLFEAAAEAYRREPWIYLSAEQPVKFTLPALGKSGYIQLMGNSAIEYGLLLYWSWEDLERSYLNTGDPRPTLPENGLFALSYVTSDLMAPDDLEACKVYGWPIADPEAYPAFMIMFEDRIERPDPSVTQVFTCLLRALPQFVEQLEPDLQGDYFPLDMPITVVSSSGELQINLAYPAGKLRREAFPALIPLDEDMEGDDFDDEYDEENQAELDLLEDDHPQIPDDEGEEYETITEWKTSPVGQRNPALVRAMGMVYEAWEEDEPERRIRLVRQALEASPDCADAYILLAEELAVNIGQALKYYQKGVEAGRRSLGEDFFDLYRGKFWDHIEAHPYLRAQSGLAHTLWELGRRPDALEICREMLSLDPADHLAARYGALLLLMDLGQVDEAYTFAVSHQDPSTTWQYTTTLLAFQRTGESPEANECLMQAMMANPHVPDYLTGRKRLPINIPEDTRPGHKSEALEYAHNFVSFWRLAPGAIDWLRKTARSKAQAEKSEPIQSKKRHHRRK